ncbi:hypothetical protein ACWDR0_23615 [Streptomyces sp. NPDC003691]
MRDHDDTPPAIRNDLPPILAGAACATAGTGVALALLGSDSPLRAPFVLFFLFAAPAAGLFALLRRMEPGARTAAAVAGAGAIDLAAAAALSGLEALSTGSSVAVIVTVSALLFLWAAADRRNERSMPEQIHQ